MNLPTPGPAYSQDNEAQTRAVLEREDKKNLKQGNPIVLQSPNGTRFLLTVDNAGVVSGTAIA